ncbi:MAG: DUF4180 domain-containing protein [Pedobacter sp.]|uniref:DUF4180 domain-containing protein n=1 Tax=Pedobacter sp. TaxID=1411316 RepID=UPI002808B916|nr:DUF4180 domain-containing protein [Pedobacter sp.]MDQ8005614.1 DUF4180 domain-containing protein [Pedobacter sp.]
MEIVKVSDSIAEVVADNLVISKIEDGIDLVGNVYYQGFDNVILHEKNITPLFFDLSTKMAGEILQKFSNYKMRLAIVGNFANYQSKSFIDFVFESNKLGRINFVNSKSEAIEALSK